MLTTSITPSAAAGTVVQGLLNVISNTSITTQTQTVGSFPYTYSVSS